MTIYKYPLQTEEVQKVFIKGFVKFLCVQTQQNKPMIWCVVDDKYLNDVEITIVTVGTGHELNVEPNMYVGTYQLFNGGLVFHVFADYKTIF
jgi:hypothetical protein